MTHNIPPPMILVVDDQEANLRVVGTVLTQAGFEVVPATSGAQALKRLEARMPDLVLLDLLMPDMNGIETCRRIKADSRFTDLPVIFLSAADDSQHVVQALESGGVDYITKPFNKSELLTRVRTHVSLKKARDELRMLAEDKDEMLGILTHDLKNHLAGMRMSASLLADRSDELPARCATMAENIVQSTDRMLAFVKEFLANQTAERLTLKLRPVDLVELVRSVHRHHAIAASVKEISVLPCESDGAIVVTADFEALRQVVDNLISNAVKFTPAGGKISVNCRPGEGRMAQFTVQDSGPGFTEADRARLFQRYGRLTARPTGGEPSSGLGLSIVKRLVEAMHGTITLESRPGEGAHFRVLLPLAEEPPAS
jgi:two-component system sensor histidine kinase/response regulator